MYEIAFHTGVKAICDGGLVRFRRNESSTDHIGDAVYLIGTLALGKADKYSHTGTYSVHWKATSIWEHREEYLKQEESEVEEPCQVLQL